MNKSLFATTVALVIITTASPIAVSHGQAAILQDESTWQRLTPSDTSSFHATLHSFIDACNEVYDLAESTNAGVDVTPQLLPAFDRIRDCLDLSALSGDVRDSMGIESAVGLKEVLDRIPLPSAEAIPKSSSPNGMPDKHWRIPGTRITIQSVEESSQNETFRFSADTVRRASAMYGMVKELPYRSEGPRTSPGLRERYLALTKRQPTLSADTSSPRGTLTLFLDRTQEVFELSQSTRYVDRLDLKYRPVIEQIYSCLDLSGLPDYSREYYASEAAVCLKEILDRTALPSIENIPGPENLQALEGGDLLANWQIPNTQISIARITQGAQQGQYQFTSESVINAVTMYDRSKRLPYRSDGPLVSPQLHDWFLSAPSNPVVAKIVEVLPELFRYRVLGLAIWQMLGLTLVTALGIGTMLLLYRIGGLRSQKAFKASLIHYWISLLFTLAALLVPLAFKHIVWVYLSIKGTPLYITNFSADVVFLLAAMVGILATSGRLANSVLALPGIRSQEVDATLVRILFRLLGIIASVIVFLEGGRYLGFPISTLLASAGIGGLAIALSAQGTVKGLFGTVTILLDRPYLAGERIVVKGHDGVVEEIGLRSTKIREFLTNNLISVPNDQMAESDIVNIGKRTNIHRLCDLHIPIDTSLVKLEKALDAIRGVLAKQEGMDPEFPAKAFFTDYHPDSFNVRIIYWHVPPDMWSYYESCERINLEIFRAFEENGIQFSLPIRHSYWKTDDTQGPLDVSLIERTSC